MEQEKIMIKPMRHLEKKHIITLIKSIFVNEITESMLLYFNNMRTNSSIAINVDLKYTRHLISQFYDFSKNENNFAYKELCNIYSYLKKENFDIPYLQKEISEDKFIEIFDYINNNFYNENENEDEENEEYERNKEDKNLTKITNIITKIRVNQKMASR